MPNILDFGKVDLWNLDILKAKLELETLKGQKGDPGPPGKPGKPGIDGASGAAGMASTENVTAQLVAGETISSPRVVMLNAGQAFLFDPASEANYFKIAGVSHNAVSAGGLVNVVLEGPLSSPGSFVADATYFAGASGALTTSVPTSGLLAKIGYARSVDVLIVDISIPVVLA